MTYIDAWHDTNNDIIKVSERNNGSRIIREYPTNYTFYYKDPKGKHRTIFDDRVTRVHCKTTRQFRKELACFKDEDLFETDLNQVQVCLSTYYANQSLPDLNIAFFDIETGFDPDRGYAPPNDPFNPITAISVHLSWIDSLFCLAVIPPSLTKEQAEKLVEEFPNTLLFETDKELLDVFLDLIEDADLLSGWNSAAFDIPYIVNRISRVMSKDDTRRLCLWNQYPKKREYEKFGNTVETYDLIGRVHLDSLDLYQNFTYEERQSYKLDSIAEYELSEKKTEYSGSLDFLYKRDFNTFVRYSRQDTMLLVKLNNKLRFISTANALAHKNTVLLKTTLGAVAVTEQAIINAAHSSDLVVPNKKRHVEKKQAAGAYVAYPKKGIHKYVGSLDINSLYPSAIRALNMSPETILGQLRPTLTDQFIATKSYNNGKTAIPFAQCWEGLFGTLEYTAVMNRERGTNLIIDCENGESSEMSAAAIYDLIFSKGNNWMLSANGTIFTYEREGIIPSLLKTWYQERQMQQHELSITESLTKGVQIFNAKEYLGVSASESKLDIGPAPHLIKQAIENDDVEFIKTQISNGILVLQKDIIKYRDQIATLVSEYWEKQQHVTKINLNSLYGSILNPGCRFFDPRIGQSTTLTGRQVVKHMASKVNEIITGKYDHIGDACIYSDTDSIYFSSYPMLKREIETKQIHWDKDVVVKLYDQIRDEVNESFCDFMKSAFNCPHNRGTVIRSSRELVSTIGLFITKKRYALIYYDIKGKRVDINGLEGKIKAMGLDLKRSDTPTYIQQFLMQVLEQVLAGKSKDDIVSFISEFRQKFKEIPGWEKGTPKRVKNLSKFKSQLTQKGQVNMPGHVRASLNWNTLRSIHNDKESLQITDGSKIIVCKLATNIHGYTSVAYPIDEIQLPEWFKQLNFDHNEMEKTLIDKKLDNLLGVLNWDLQDHSSTNAFDDLFEF